MKVNYLKKDILTLDLTDYAIVHCISGDFSLGAGLAKKIRDMFDMSNKLKDKYTYVDGCYGCFPIDNILNLVTKDKWKDSTDYSNMDKALQSLNEYLHYSDVRKIAMPKLGTGKDKLDWDLVYSLIEKNLSELNIDLYICTL